MREEAPAKGGSKCVCDAITHQDNEGEVLMSPQRAHEILVRNHNFEFKIQNSSVLLVSHCLPLRPGL